MLDVKKYALGLPEIIKHMHTNLKNPETIEGQRRMLRKWEAERDKMQSFSRAGNDVTSAWQLERVSLLVDFAYSTHPFYHELYKAAGYERGAIISWDDYNALPTISKDDLINNYEIFTANLAPSVEQCDSYRTSGSSGRALQVHRDLTMTDYHALQEMRFFETILGRDRKPSDLLYLSYLACPPYTSLDGKYPIFTVSNECPQEAVLEHIKLLKPQILSGFPSYLLRLAELVDDPSELGIEAISTNSEACTKAERLKIASRMGAPVFDEYSSIELGYIATECKEGNYHIMEDNVRLDVLNPDENGRGEIVATNLVNTFWPMIRYRQGDIIKIGSKFNSCACGNKFLTLDEFMGRSDQMLHSNAIGVVPADKIMALYDRTLIPADALVDEFKIIQHKEDEVEVLIVPASNHEHANTAAVTEFANGLKELFEDANLNIKIQELTTLPPEKSHKRRLIENRIEKREPNIIQP